MKHVSLLQKMSEKIIKEKDYKKNSAYKSISNTEYKKQK